MPSCARALGRPHIPINALKTNILSHKSFPYVYKLQLPLKTSYHSFLSQFNLTKRWVSLLIFSRLLVFDPSVSHHLAFLPPLFFSTLPVAAEWFLTVGKARKAMRWLVWKRGWPGSKPLLCCRLSVRSWVRQSLRGLVCALWRWGAAWPWPWEELGIVITTPEKMSCTGCAGCERLGWYLGCIAFPGRQGLKSCWFPRQAAFLEQSRFALPPLPLLSSLPEPQLPRACFCLY